MKQSTYLRKVLAALEDAGYKLVAVDDGGDELVVVGGLMDVMTAARAVEDCYVIVGKNLTRSWLRVVWQGPDDSTPNGEEVVCDYTIDLEPVIQSVEVPVS